MSLCSDCDFCPQKHNLCISLSHSSPSILFATHREINASPSFPTNFANALLSFDINSDGVIDYQEFLMMEKRFPIIMFPAFRLQDNLQRGTLGQCCVSVCVSACVCVYMRERVCMCVCVRLSVSGLALSLRI